MSFYCFTLQLIFSPFECLVPFPSSHNLSIEIPLQLFSKPFQVLFRERLMGDNCIQTSQGGLSMAASTVVSLDS